MTDDLEARLAKLHARRTPSTPRAASAERTTAPPEPTADLLPSGRASVPAAPSAVKKQKRRNPAEATRILTTGIAASAALMLINIINANAPTFAGTPTADPLLPTTSSAPGAPAPGPASTATAPAAPPDPAAAPADPPASPAGRNTGSAPAAAPAPAPTAAPAPAPTAAPAPVVTAPPPTQAPTPTTAPTRTCPSGQAKC